MTKNSSIFFANDANGFLDFCNKILGKGVVPAVSIIGIVCDLLTILFDHLYGIDRAALVFVEHVSIADLLATLCNGLLVVRYVVQVLRL